LSELSRLTSLENDQERAIVLVEESSALFHQLDDACGLVVALMHRAWPAIALADYETAKRVCQQGLLRLAQDEDPWLRGQLLMYLADASAFTYDFEAMRSFYAQSRAIFEQLGDKCALADVLKDQGALLQMESRYAEAIDCLLESITLCRELDHRQFITTGMCWLSFAFGLRGEPDPATASLYSAQLEGAAESLMETIGIIPWVNTHPLTQMVRKQIRSQVDEQSWQAALATGRSLTAEQAIELARRLAEDL
jgi:tetratricopeptide (TPR) repeat protein